MPAGGFIKRGFKWGDYSFHKIYGTSEPVPIVPLGRDFSKIPVVYQGSTQTCVSCAVTWIQMVLKMNFVPLSHEYLAEISNTTQRGASTDQVLEAARHIGIAEEEAWKNDPEPWSAQLEANASFHKIAGYAYLHDLSKQTIYQALKLGPIMVGVDDWCGVGPHMMAGFDVTEDGTKVRCANWWVETSQQIDEVPFEKITFACSILTEQPTNNVTMNPFIVFLSKVESALGTAWYKLKSYAKHEATKLIAGLLVGTGLVGGVAGVYGASGVVARFSTTLAVGITSTATSVQVSSLVLADGETMTSSNVTFPLYLTINNGGSTAEDIECVSLSSTTFNCPTRGLSWLGGAATSSVTALKFAHSAGEKVTMSNTPYFYNRFVDTTAAQVIAGVKNFVSGVTVGGTGATGKIAWNGSALTWTNDGVNTYAFTNSSPSVLSASTTKGIGITDSKIYVNGSSTKGLAFDTLDGKLYISASSTASGNGGFLKFTTAGKEYWDIASFIAGHWAWPTPTQANDPVTKNYADVAVAFGSATGTAWQAITAGQALWVTATSSLRVTSSSAASSTYQFVGFAQDSKAAGQTVTYSTPGSINCKQSGLKPGMNYYLSGTTGGIATTPGSYSARVGRALSATCIQVVEPKFVARGVATISGTGDTVITTGFYPAKITLLAGILSGTGGGTVASVGGLWANGMMVQPAGGLIYAGYDWIASDAGGQSEGTVSARTATTFTINCYGKSSTASVSVYWEASSD